MTRQTLARRLRRHPHRQLPPPLRSTLKRQVLTDCQRRCVYCDAPLTGTSVTLDHVLPLARGGTNDPRNVVAACGPCNHDKAALHPDAWFDYHPTAAATFLRRASHARIDLVASARDALASPYREPTVARR